MRPSIEEKASYNMLAERLSKQVADNNNVNNLESYFKKSDKIDLEEIQVNNNTENYVGIYKLDKETGFYHRDNSFYRASCWSQAPVIPPKSSKRRILLLGESVARGYFYEPNYSPASILETILNKFSKNGEVEVIDLACSSINLEPLKDLFNSCFALEPDHIVFFAGNNWINTLQGSFSIEDFELIDNYLEENKRGEIRKTLEERFVQIIESFLNHISQLCKENNVKVSFIIPEYNLKDYLSSSFEKRVSWFSRENEVSRWSLNKKGIEHALLLGDLEKAEALVEEMITINELHPYPYEVLAKIKLENGEPEEARRLYELAKDTGLFQTIRMPKSPSIIRKIILKNGPFLGIKIIDLPTRFEEIYKDKIPGKEVFLDYCHLTLEGIKSSMAFTAQSLLEEFSHMESFFPLYDISLIIDKNVIGLAHFFAAIHNAHYGPQSFDVLFYHSYVAAEQSPLVRDIMPLFAELTTQRLERSYTKIYGKLIEKGGWNQYEGGIALTYQLAKHLDIHLGDVFIAVLKKFDIDIEDKILTLRKQNFGISEKGKCNLLQDYYYVNSYLEVMRERRHAFFQSLDIISEFYIISEKSDIIINVTFRIQSKAKESIAISINNHLLETVEVDHKWRNARIKIQREYMKDGINILTIEWPHKLQRSEEEFYKMPVKDRVLKSIFQVFGEIATLTVEYKNH